MSLNLSMREQIMSNKESSLRWSITYIIVIALLHASIFLPITSGAVEPIHNLTPSNTDDDAQATLDQGLNLLRRNRADQAIDYLEKALQLFAQTNNANGKATAQDALGDIYARQGQYEGALKYYQDAYASSRNSSPNANMLLAKIGETYHRLGKTEQAKAAFAQMKNNSSNSSNGGAISASLGTQSRSMANSASNVTSSASNVTSTAGSSSSSLSSSLGQGLSSMACAPFDKPIPNMGHAPKKVDGIGRMDLRVYDPNGNPVKGARARLFSKRPNNFLCDSPGITNDAGVAVLPPLHCGKLTLEIKADGFQPQKIDVLAQSLDKPVRVTLQSKNPVSSSIGSCSNIFSNFISQATSEIGMGRMDYMSNQLDSARSHFENVLNASNSGLLGIALMRQAKRARIAARTSLGDIAFDQGRYQDAIKIYTEAIEESRQGKMPDLMWAAQRGLGRCHWALSLKETDQQKIAKGREDAINSYREAIKTIESIFAGGLRADEARTTFLATTNEVFNEASSILAEMALMLSPSSSKQLNGQALAYASEALKFVEQGRARSLLDLLGESKAQITEGVSPDLLDRKAENLARQQELAQQLIGINPTGGSGLPIRELEAELNNLSAEYDWIENMIRARSPRYTSLTAPSPLTLSDIQMKVLDGRTILLEYSLGKDSSYLWAVTQRGLSLYKLPAREVIEKKAVEVRTHLIPAKVRRAIVGIDQLATQDKQRGLGLGGSLTNDNASTYASKAYELYKMIVEPASAVITNNSRLLIAADGALNYIPFEALVTKAEGSSYSELAYLVKSNELIYAPSASVIAVIREHRAAQSGQSVLVVADPIFDSSDPRVKGGTVPTSTGEKLRGLALGSALTDITSAPSSPTNIRLARLDGTRTEAEHITQLVRTAGKQADSWLDFDASESNVTKRDIKQYRVLHFATHGLLNAERPQFTGLVLSLIGDTDGDGFLRVNEIFNLKLGAPLVMLSACETGLGKEKRGEGVIGLTRAFMYAGAPTVGVSLWSVADKSTAEMMPNFYKQLLEAQNVSPTVALRSAQQQMIASKQYSAPFFWAPFVLVGDWK
jgi:CHAT domain-containing protein